MSGSTASMADIKELTGFMALYGKIRRTALVFNRGCPVVGQTAETLQPSFSNTMAIRAAQGHQLVFVSSTVGYTVSYSILLKSSHPQCYKNYKIQETPFYYRRETTGAWVESGSHAVTPPT